MGSFELSGYDQERLRPVAARTAVRFYNYVRDGECKLACYRDVKNALRSDPGFLCEETRARMWLDATTWQMVLHLLGYLKTD